MKNFPQIVNNILYPYKTSYGSKRTLSQDFNLQSFISVLERPKSCQKQTRPSSPVTKPSAPNPQPNKSHKKIKSIPRRLTELEQENLLLKQELQKSKQILKAATIKLSKSPIPENIIEDYLQQSLYLDLLQQENEKFRKIFSASHEINKYKLILFRLSEKIISLEKENQKLSEELQRLNRGGHYISSKFSRLEVLPMISAIFKACCKLRLNIDELGFVLNPNGQSDLNINQLILGFKAISLDFSPAQVKFLLQSIVGYEVEEIAQNRIIEGIKYLNKGFIVFDDLKSEIQELRISLAAAGMDKSKLKLQYEGKKFYRDQFKQSLVEDGFGLRENCLSKIFLALFEDSEELLADEMIETVFQVFDPISFDEGEESELEQEIRQKMKENWNMFIENCKRIEVRSGLELELKDFFWVCEELGVKFSEKAEVYLMVYFYTQTFRIDRVPYVNFYLTFN